MIEKLIIEVIIVKRPLIFMLFLLLMFSLTACSNASNVSSHTNYTKEFLYLPAYANMEFQSITQPDKNQNTTARYLIKDTTPDKVLNDYGDILKKNGWTLNWNYTKDKTPYSFVAQKDQHTAFLLPVKNGNDVLLTITSK